MWSLPLWTFVSWNNQTGLPGLRQCSINTDEFSVTLLFYSSVQFPPQKKGKIGTFSLLDKNLWNYLIFPSLCALESQRPSRSSFMNELLIHLYTRWVQGIWLPIKRKKKLSGFSGLGLPHFSKAQLEIIWAYTLGNQHCFTLKLLPTWI